MREHLLRARQGRMSGLCLEPLRRSCGGQLGRRSISMETPDTLRYTKIPLNNGSGVLPAVGFGTLISHPVATKQAAKTALEVGFRHLDCAERYRNEEGGGG